MLYFQLLLGAIYRCPPVPRVRMITQPYLVFKVTRVTHFSHVCGVRSGWVWARPYVVIAN